MVIGLGAGINSGAASGLLAQEIANNKGHEKVTIIDRLHAATAATSIGMIVVASLK